MSRGSAAAEVGRVAPVFAALGDETRLGLFARLAAGGPQSISRLADGAAVTRQAVTKHLEVLAAAGLVSGARRGRERVFGLAPDRLEDARAVLRDLSGRWDAALERLRRLVED